MFIREEFEKEKEIEIANAVADMELIKKGRDFLFNADKHKYGYFWRFMDLPVIQMPVDIVLTQEILWDLKPDIVIEAGVAWGGSLAMYAAFQELYGNGHTYGIDVTIPNHNREAIMQTPVSHRITLIEGSSVDLKIFRQVSEAIGINKRILLILDSNHSETHVYNELVLWSKILRKGDFIIVSDTFLEEIPIQTHRPRPWGPGNNPMTALKRFLLENDRFTYDNEYTKRAISSFNPFGYLSCIK